MFNRMNESFKNKINKTILCSTFVFYLIILIWIVIFKTNSTEGLDGSIRLMIPLNVLDRFLYQFRFNLKLDLIIPDLILNIIIFIPFTFCLKFFNEKINVWQAMLYSFSLSFTFEIIQLFTAIGGFSFLDLITNVLGGLIGFGIYKLFNKHVSNLLTNYIALIISIIALPIAIYAIANTIIHYEYYIPFFDGTSFKNLFTFN